MIQIKRAYEPAEKSDGQRFLVDRLWPRGVKKEALKMDGWLKDAAPSNTLRKWFSHDPARWKEFQRRCRSELTDRPETWHPLLEVAQTADVTLLFSAHDLEHNNAVVLKALLEHRLKSRGKKAGTK